MLADVQAFVEDQNIDFIDEYKSTDADHGRIEERSYRVYDIPEYLVDRHDWLHLQAFVQVISKCETGGKTSHSERLYLMSKRPHGSRRRNSNPRPLADRKQLALVARRCHGR